jgi:formiminotetrahydrofolate cyclodeaminase
LADTLDEDYNRAYQYSHFPEQAAQMPDDHSNSNLTELTVSKFLDALASASPTPGGGSAAALSGAAAAALVSMVARISVAKGPNPGANARLAEIERRATALQGTLAELIDRDASAYASVLSAYRLPKETPNERADRSAAIQAGFILSAQSPLETAAACAEVLELAGEVAELGLSSASSDAAVAALLAHAGLRGGALNVAVNLENIKDARFVQQADDALATMLQSSMADLNTALAHLSQGN